MPRLRRRQAPIPLPGLPPGDCPPVVHPARLSRRAGEAGSGSNDCARCHSEHNGTDHHLVRWPVPKEKFDHAQAGWKLEGRHAQLKCAECHTQKYIDPQDRSVLKRTDLSKTSAVFVAGGVLSVASIIGFITLFGVATRNGIMLVSHVKHLMTEGVNDLCEAVRRGATERLAPIFMTAMAAGLALVPVALGLGKPGSEIQAPMAIVILFGLFSSSALNMIVVPAVYVKFGKRPIME